MSVGTALITGAAKNIGRAIAERLARDGFDVACVGRSEESLAETAESVGALGRRSLTLAADVSDGAAVGAAVKTIVEEWGGIDVLVNNAGITRDQLLLRMGEEDFDQVLDVNLKGCFHFSKAVARVMIIAVNR